DVDGFGAGDFADYGFDCCGDFVLDLLGGQDARLQGDVHDRDAALYVVYGGDDCSFGYFGDAQAGGRYLFFAEAVTCYVDYVVYAAQNTVIVIGCEDSAVSRVIGPVAPVFALRIFAVFFVVLIYKAFVAAPDGLHDAGP